jgi:Chaperone of endosialidase
MKKLSLLLLALPTLVLAQSTFNLYGPAAGIQKNTGSTYLDTAAASSDVIALWTGTCSSSTFLRGDGACATAGSGTVTSVAFADGSTSPIYTITGSPVTTSGTLTETLSTESANTLFAGPTTGSAAQPTFRTLVAADFPSATVPLTSIAQIANNTVLGNNSGSTASPSALTSIQNIPIGSTTANTGAFTTLTANGAVNLNASNNAATNIGTGSTTSAVTLGGASNTTTVASLLNLNQSSGFSAAQWGLTGLQFTIQAVTLTDTSSSGTVGSEAADGIGSPTIAASNTGVTYTNFATLYINSPIAGTHVTITNPFSLITAGQVKFNGLAVANAGLTVPADGININGGGLTITAGNASLLATTITGATSINASNNATTNIGTGTTTSTVTIGGSSNTTSLSSATLDIPNISSNTGAQTGYLCWSSTGGNVTYDGTNTCLVSAARFKKDIAPLGAALDEVMHLKPVSFLYRDPFPGDINMANEQIGFIAEDVAQVEPRLVTYDKDGQLHGVRYEQMTSLLTKGEQELQAEVAALQAQNARLEARLAALEHSKGK